MLAGELENTTLWRHALNRMKWATAAFVLGVVVLIVALATATSFVVAFGGFVVMLAATLWFERNARSWAGPAGSTSAAPLAPAGCATTSVAPSSACVTASTATTDAQAGARAAGAPRRRRAGRLRATPPRRRPGERGSIGVEGPPGPSHPVVATSTNAEARSRASTAASAVTPSGFHAAVVAARASRSGLAGATAVPVATAAPGRAVRQPTARRTRGGSPPDGGRGRAAPTPPAPRSTPPAPRSAGDRARPAALRRADARVAAMSRRRAAAERDEAPTPAHHGSRPDEPWCGRLASGPAVPGRGALVVGPVGRQRAGCGGGRCDRGGRTARLRVAGDGLLGLHAGVARPRWGRRGRAWARTAPSRCRPR